MTKEFNQFTTDAIFKLGDETLLQSFKKSQKLPLFTFIRTKEKQASLYIDDVITTIPPNSILSLTPNHFIKVVDLRNVIIYQFNREFYCIKDHDKEVSCVGVLFYGHHQKPIIELNKTELKKFNVLHDIFLDEMETEDTIQAEMLRMLMTRFIIKTTRLYKQGNQLPETEKIDLLRHFNVLVEDHFRNEHSVKFYADKLFKSPKTLSNSFAKYDRSPLQIIHDRIVLEAKRLLHYTDKSAKQIAFDLGFEDPSHLSRLFKKHTGQSPSTIRGSK
ncbi:AraC family transcriptional regulator [Spongiivirga citrea]|uniref:Helix-turn-helix domain-containing protein n=1 Tax=Spongiivirga citrea TaxID=1481457 RepID=A0A6M0CKA9_9FLAO|nr:helix-turn-helix domain-containing protein [Spongiivirga citrea]NER18375.1 helix-turn-helix domain-containing protein [Spongiivirga citrea]